ncbi:MAG: hypothetical protein JST26_10580 [Bacteroidetes bacterium]|nr:hypothetical protein [Bacteroidota bacterium]
MLTCKSDLVQREGLNHLIPSWQQFVEIYAESESLIYEWINDLSTRAIIDEILSVLSEQERKKIERDLAPADQMLKEKTFEVHECVWSDNVAAKENFDRRKHWYYYRVNQLVFENETGRFTKYL